MFDANRWGWNLLVEKIQKEILWGSKESEVLKLCNGFLAKKHHPKNLEVTKCHNDCFGSATRDFVKARKTTMALSKAQKKSTGKGFIYPDQLRFRSKKFEKGSIEIRARDIKYSFESRTISFYPTYFGKDEKEIKIKTNLKKFGINYACRLQMHHDRFYLNIPYIREVESIKTTRVCALDPGVRTFLTGYDPKYRSFEIGKENTHVYSKEKRIDALKSKLSNEKDIYKRVKLEKRIRNLYWKIGNCVSDLHHVASKWLVQNYDTILLSEFETQKIVDKTNKKRNIGKPTARNMMTLAHYKFKELLKHKCNVYNKKLIICTEEHTTKTCGNCGRLNPTIGSKKVFKCDCCDYISDRDINAARNIFIKNTNLVDNVLDYLPVSEPAESKTTK